MLSLVFVLQLNAKNYYLGSRGDDNNSGADSAQAWQTIAKLSTIHLYPGDSVLFKGGDTIPGIIYVTALDSGTDAMPVVFSSYGIGRASINAGEGAGFYGYNSGGFAIDNINFFGSGIASNTNSGIIFYTDTSNGHKFSHVYINNSNVSGFGQCGIIIGSYHSSYPGYQGIRITNVTVTNVKQKGIFVYDFGSQNSTLYGHKDLYIGHCTVMYSGIEGILVSGVDSGLVEYCRAGYTGYNTNTGDAGIWAYSANNITFQYCISDHATTTGSDGEGFDLDGGTQNCVIQYCYAYQNYACGFMHCDYPGSRPNYNNIVRYCISENDGRKPVDDESSFLFISWGTGVNHCYMYNNTAFISDNGSHPVSAMRGYILTGSVPNPFITNCMALNNILYVYGSNHNALVSLYNPNGTLTNSNIFFAGNCYFSTNSQNWVNNSNSYSSLRNWQDSTGQETINNIRKGYLLNPGLQNPGGAGAVLDPDSLKYIFAYKLKVNDPIIGRGLDIDTLFGLKSPLYDFYGDTLNPFEVYSMGVDDPQPNKRPRAGFYVTNTCFGDSTFFTDSSSGAVTHYWNFGDTASGSLDTSILASPSHKYLKPGSYIATQVVRSIYGYYDSLKKPVEIYAKPAAKFYAASTCLSNPVHFVDSSINATFFSWHFGDGDSTNEENPTYLYNSPGFDTIALTVFSSNGCKDSTSKVISVFPLPVPAFTAVNACPGDPVLFYDTSTVTSLYAWDFGDSSAGLSGNNPKHIYTLPAKYRVVLTATSNQGCVDTVSHFVEIYSLPNANFNYSVTMTTLQAKAIDSTEPYYDWNFGDMDSISGSYEASHNYIKNGSYEVTLTLRNKYGCEAKKPDTVLVSTTGIEMQQVNGDDIINIYPNPFIDNVVLNYSIARQGVVKITVMDAEGNLVKIISDNNQTSGNHAIVINGETLNMNAGIYFLKLQSNEQIAEIKLVKL